jgi:hypothetical protein
MNDNKAFQKPEVLSGRVLTFLVLGALGTFAAIFAMMHFIKV